MFWAIFARIHVLFCFFQYLDVRNEMNMHMLIWSVPAEEQLYDENNIWNKNTRTQYKIKFKAYE